MENLESPSTPRCSMSNNIKADIIGNFTPSSRKPLAQITNTGLKNYSSPFRSTASSLPSKCTCLTINELLSSEHYHSSENKADPATVNNYSNMKEHSSVDDLAMISAAEKAGIISTPISSTARLLDTAQNTAEEQNTPKPFVPYNPFEIGPEVLHLPAVSPSLFKEVVSPSEKEETNFAWAIDNLALLRPVPIESPLHDMEIPRDPEYEKKAQEAIDRFFSNAVIVPSPWTSSSTQSLNLMSLFSSASPHNLQMMSASPALYSASREGQIECSKMPTVTETVQSYSKVSSWSQTELTLPPILPKEIEDALAPFCTFTQEQAYQNIEEIDDSSAMNNTTLRRKLLFSDERSSAPRLSNSSIRESSEIELGKGKEFEFSSPARPLPFDEDEEALPWGVSMIRPSSRVSPRHPLSSPFERTLSPSPSQGRIFPMLSPNEVSPIAYVSPKELRSLPSPSECYQTPSRRRFLESPKLSPILNYSPKHHHHLKTPPVSVIKFAEMPRSPLEYPRGKRGRNLCLEGPNTSLSQFESTSLSNDKISSPYGKGNKYFTKEIETGSQGFTCTAEKDVSRNQRTPMVREAHRLLFKTSPHFSSSPIKGNNSNSSSCRLDFDRIDENDGSSKFSDSPPVSPISWQSETQRFSNDVSFKDIEENCQKVQDECRGSENYPMDPVTETGSSEGLIIPALNSSGAKFSDEMRDDEESDSEFSDHIEVFGSNGTSADMDCPIFNEGSTLEEMSSGQDTGYQTGTSLQITNQSNYLSGSTSLSKDTTKHSSNTYIPDSHFSIFKETMDHPIAHSHKGKDLPNN